MPDQISRSVVSDSLRPHRRHPTRLPRPWDSLGKNTEVGCHFLLRLIKLTKIKHTERILKAAREMQQVTYKGNPICLTADLSTETLQARRVWQDIFKELKWKNLQPRLLSLARISFKMDEKIKSFSDKQKLREFSTTKPALQQMLKGLI